MSKVVQNSEGASFELRERSCPTCGLSKTRLLGLRGGRHHRYALGAETPIVQCTRCSLIFPNPFPYPLEPSELYGDPDKYFAAQDEAGKVMGFRGLARQIVARTRKSDPSVLDVGCGRGEFLEAARQEGFAAVTGLELSTAIAQYAAAREGVRVHQMAIERFAETCDERFDAIVLSAVLEHVHDPDAMISAAARLANPGAALYFEVPCEPHLLSMVGNTLNRLKRDPAVYNLSPTWPPYHVFGFNPKALRILFEKHGFVLEELRVWAWPGIRSNGELKDRVRAFAATQIIRVANVLGCSSNMSGWARRRNDGPALG